jgi:RNA polymerase sigma-54 factor
MALKQTQNLKLAQKLLPQQILLMKLLQLPTLALEERIKEELEANPALEEDVETTQEEENYEEVDVNNEDQFDENGDLKENDENISTNDVEMEDYMDDEELDSYKYEVSNKGADDETREFVVVEGPGFQELLEQQLGLRAISETEYIIGTY